MVPRSSISPILDSFLCFSLKGSGGQPLFPFLFAHHSRHNIVSPIGLPPEIEKIFEKPSLDTNIK
ncbi:MAG: hypothetical protein JRF49_11520 [Deltaproteobacteria bacterium]|jgi:hypothetical protein|nr:hypothetical protein [Deltaproteobacteria bacterium]